MTAATPYRSEQDDTWTKRRVFSVFASLQFDKMFNSRDIYEGRAIHKSVNHQAARGPMASSLDRRHMLVGL